MIVIGLLTIVGGLAHIYLNSPQLMENLTFWPIASGGIVFLIGLIIEAVTGAELPRSPSDDESNMNLGN